LYILYDFVYNIVRDWVADAGHGASCPSLRARPGFSPPAAGSLTRTRILVLLFEVEFKIPGRRAGPGDSVELEPSRRPRPLTPGPPPRRRARRRRHPLPARPGTGPGPAGAAARFRLRLRRRDSASRAAPAPPAGADCRSP
jgi:hypothetical protein